MYVRMAVEQRCSTNGANSGEDDGTISKKAVAKKAKEHKQRPVHTHKAEQTQEQKQKQKWQAPGHNQQRTVGEIVNVLVTQVQDQSVPRSRCSATAVGTTGEDTWRWAAII